jgi:hypothetical protein
MNGFLITWKEVHETETPSILVNYMPAGSGFRRHVIMLAQVRHSPWPDNHAAGHAEMDQPRQASLESHKDIFCPPI